MVDLKFIDLPGIWQHTTVPAHRLKEESFDDGFGFDGSSIRGFQAIHASDMLLIPDPSSARMDPFTKEPYLSLLCNVVDPITREPYSRDPRYIAQKAERHVKQTGVADVIYFGPEAEFFIFDDVRYDTTPNAAYYYLDSAEARWNTGREEFPNLGYKTAYKGGYFPVAPSDTLVDLRTEIALTLATVGIHVEVHH